METTQAFDAAMIARTLAQPMPSRISWANAHRLADDFQAEMLSLEADAICAIAAKRPASNWIGK